MSLALPLPAKSLTQSTVTEVIREVNLLPAATRAAQPAKLNDLVKAPDLVRTGPQSRAELTAPDSTITRVGANTVFSFQSGGRAIDLKQGSLLFHAPAGRGGGEIRSGAASAAVAGTTLIVAATANSGFKVIVLEGRGWVTLPDGRTLSLRAGQMVYVLPGGQASRVLDINLGGLVAGSLLVNGFTQPLASLPKIREAVRDQDKQIAKGRLKETRMPADVVIEGKSGFEKLDSTTARIGVTGAARGGQGKLQLPPLDTGGNPGGNPGPPPPIP